MNKTDTFDGLELIANRIIPQGMSGQDATGGTVGSLTEAVMGMTAALVQIAESISELSDAVRSRND